MLSSLLTIFYIILVHNACASPIRRIPDIEHRANAAAGRFMALSDPISIHLIRARTTGPTGVTTTNFEPTAPASASNGKEDGKVPAVGVGAGNTSLLALLNPTASLAPPLPSQTVTSKLSEISATSPTGSPDQAATETTPTPNSPSSCITQTSAVGFPAQITAPTSSTSNQVGKVPAVGVGSDNTSLLTLLSSVEDVSAQTSPFVTIDGMPSAQTSTAFEPAPPSSTTGSCTDIDSSTVSTSMALVPASQTTASSETSGSTPTPESFSESSSTIVAPIPVDESPTTSSATDEIPATAFIPISSTGSSEQSAAPTSEPTTMLVPIPDARSPDESKTANAMPTTTSAPIPAGGTVTLQISTDATITVPFSEPVFPKPQTPLAVSVSSPASISSDIEETLTVLVSTSPVTAISSSSDFASVPASLPDVGVPGSPFASTTVRPLSDPSSYVTQSTAVIPPPSPVVSIQTPGVSSEATASAPAPTAGGNTVIPVMGSTLTIMVTTTVTASQT